MNRFAYPLLRTLVILGFFVSSPRSPGNPRSETSTEGQHIFRYDTFGSEAFWGGKLKLHEAIAGRNFNGVGAGVSPRTALSVGLRVDRDALPEPVVGQLAAGQVNLDDPGTTLDLLRLNAVVGVTGFFDKAGQLRSIGIQCALCHSDVDHSLAPGIGRRLDGWPNRRLNVGAIVNLAPDLQAFTAALGTDEATVRKVLLSWGPGRYDAHLILDGKAFRPDGKTAATLLPPAYGLAGVNLHTYTGMGSVTYWNAYVAVTQMHGQGTFYDRRLAQPDQFPLSARNGWWNIHNTPDLVTPKLSALHRYQLELTAPVAPKGSFNAEMAKQGRILFEHKAKCASCHVPPLFTEPGQNIHSPEEIGIDSFQSDRSPTRGYRTTPLKGLWAHQTGGFYHDGRFADLRDVIDHYDAHLKLQLSDQEKAQLKEYLLSL